MAIDGSITLPLYAAEAYGDMYGDADLGAETYGATIWTLEGVLHPGAWTRGDSFLPEFGVAGGIDEVRALPLFDAAAAGFAGTVANGDADMPQFGLAGGIDDERALPLFAVDAFGSSGILTTGASVLLPFTAGGSLEPALALPQLAVAASGYVGQVASGAVSLPQFGAAASFGTMGDSTLPQLTVSASGFNSGVAGAGVTLPAFIALGFAYQNNVAAGDLTLGIYAAAGEAGAISRIDGAVSLPAFELAAMAGSGAVAEAVLSLPLYAVDATGYADAVGQAHLAMPAFKMAGGAAMGGQLGSGPAPGASAPGMVALNTRLRAVTLYAGLHANSFATFNGVTLAATASGIVALVGNDDLGVPIAAHFASGLSDLNSEQMKTVISAYVGWRADGTLDMTMITDEHHEFVYALAPVQDSPHLHTARVKFGRGMTGSYWQWKLANRAGADFMLERIGLDVVPHKRRV